jgi:hypothetical protein
MEKVAVDTKAKNYWSTYFKDYGKMWVRDVPRRVKSAMRRIIKADKVEGNIAPMAANIADDNTLSLEAAFVGKVDGHNAKVLITAQFSPNGRMESVEAHRIV